MKTARLTAFAALVFCLALLRCGRTEPLHLFEDGGQVAMVAPVTLPDAGPTLPVACVNGHITLRKATPAVMFVLDRSGSMSTAFGKTTRWQGLTAALAATLPSIAKEMEIGGFFFPAPGNNRSCSLENATTLAPAFDNVDSLLSQMLITLPGGQTPTAPALERAGALISGVRAATSARALVLATDGAPNCNNQLNPNGCVCANNLGGGCRTSQTCLDDVRTVTQIASLKRGCYRPTSLVFKTRTTGCWSRPSTRWPRPVGDREPARSRTTARAHRLKSRVRWSAFAIRSAAASS